jgi:hypothetical protein
MTEVFTATAVGTSNPKKYLYFKNLAFSPTQKKTQ